MCKLYARQAGSVKKSSGCLIQRRKGRPQRGDEMVSVLWRTKLKFEDVESPSSEEMCVFIFRRMKKDESQGKENVTLKL